MMILIFLTLLAVTTAAMIGGWNDANVGDKNVIDAVKFAVELKFGPTAWVKEIISAKTQVVRGVNYDVTMKVMFEAPFRESTCTVDNFKVWNDLGTWHLTAHEYVSTC